MKTLNEILTFLQRIEPLDILDDDDDEQKLKNSFTYLLERVGDDEDVKFAFWCLRSVMLGHNAVLVTNKRIICGQNEMVKGRIYTQSPLFEVVLLEDVNEVHIKAPQWSLGPIGGQLTIETGEDTVRYLFPRISNRQLRGGIPETTQALQDAGLIDLIMTLKAALPPKATAKNSNQDTSEAQVQVSAADAILKYKELLDAGVITQEEFEAKKKKLLDL